MEDAPGVKPANCRELFFAFQAMSLQGFGGVLPVSQRVLVDQKRWLTRTEFLALLSLGQVLPGPNIVNMALMFGDRLFGWRGAASALAGLILAPLSIVLVLAVIVQQNIQTAVMQDMLRGMGVVAAGLVLSTAVKVIGSLRSNPIGLLASCVFILLTVTAVVVLRWPLTQVLAVLAPLACGLAWWRKRAAMRGDKPGEGG